MVIIVIALRRNSANAFWQRFPCAVLVIGTSGFRKNEIISNGVRQHNGQYTIAEKEAVHNSELKVPPKSIEALNQQSGILGIGAINANDKNTEAT